MTYEFKYSISNSNGIFYYLFIFLGLFIAIFITAFIGTIFCYFVQTIAQRYTTASKAALFFCLEPVSAGMIGYFIAGEILSSWQIFGAALIIFGVIFSEFGKQICSKFKL